MEGDRGQLLLDLAEHGGLTVNGLGPPAELSLSGAGQQTHRYSEIVSGGEATRPRWAHHK